MICHVLSTDFGYNRCVPYAADRRLHMQDWQTQFEHMRASFLSRAGDRLDKIGVLLERMQTLPSDQRVLAEVRQHFHWLCGVGGTYKLPEISDLGWEGEELCDRLADNSQTPSNGDVQRLKSLLVRVREHFAQVGVA